jgi:hypothetical protein
MVVTRPLPSLLAALLSFACSPSAPAPPAAGLPQALARGLARAAPLGRAALAAAEPAPGGRLSITHEPAVLQVYRSTRVSLTAHLPPAHAHARCRWTFGGSVAPELPPEEAPSDACAIEHTFIGGTADERVTVVASDGAWTDSATRIVPLERLPVMQRRPSSDDEARGVPDKPKGSEDFRLAIIADTSTMERAALEALAQRIVALGADVVIHLGGHAESGGQEWTLLREALAERLRAADIPLLPAVAPADLEAGSEVRRPLGKGGEQLELLDGARFPERWAFSHHGVFMAFVSGAEQSGEALDWLRTRLSEAQIYESRLVFSYLPLHPFGEAVPAGAGPHTLGPKFKVYELLLRARTTAFISAGHRVYFKGRYGALAVVSVGSAAAGGQRLLGHDVPQPASLVVMDIVRGLPEKVFALVPAPGTSTGVTEPFAAPFDEAYLPETVEVYTR